MKRFISLLRGINVGKSNRISNSVLLKFYESLGFQDIQIFIQSGNVVFSAVGVSVEVLSTRISDQFKLKLAMDIPVVVLEPDHFLKIMKKNPFQKEAFNDPSKAFIGFLSKKPDLKLLKEINIDNFKPNLIHVESTAIYLFCPNGMGRAKLPNFEKLFSIKITFRNARVAQMLAEAT